MQLDTATVIICLFNSLTVLLCYKYHMLNKMILRELQFASANNRMLSAYIQQELDNGNS